MKEWKSVTSSETAQEFVLVWYTQFWENNCGSVDSVFKMDNIELEDGKILSLDEEFRRLPKAN